MNSSTHLTNLTRTQCRRLLRKRAALKKSTEVFEKLLVFLQNLLLFWYFSKPGNKAYGYSYCYVKHQYKIHYIRQKISQLQKLMREMSKKKNINFNKQTERDFFKECHQWDVLDSSHFGERNFGFGLSDDAKKFSEKHFKIGDIVRVSISDYNMDQMWTVHHVGKIIDDK